MAQSGTGQNNNGSNLPGDRGSMAPLSRQTFGRKASGVAMLVGGLIFGSYLIFGENSRKRATAEEDSSTRISAPAVRPATRTVGARTGTASATAPTGRNHHHVGTASNSTR